MSHSTCITCHTEDKESAVDTNAQGMLESTTDPHEEDRDPLPCDPECRHRTAPRSHH
jgi:hypothetical protein